MSTMTYNSLVAQVSDYLDRTDIDTISSIPNFVYQAQQRIARDSKNLGFVVYATGNFTPTVPIYQKPVRWRRNISFNVGSGVNSNVRNALQLRSYEFLINYWPDQTQTGMPIYYADKGYSHYVVAPTPDVAYPFEYSFLQIPTPITALNQTNFLTNYAPDVLLYATLIEAMPYLKDDERIAMWNDEYRKRIDALNTQDDMRVEDRQSNRGAD